VSPIFFWWDWNQPNVLPPHTFNFFSKIIIIIIFFRPLFYFGFSGRELFRPFFVKKGETKMCRWFLVLNSWVGGVGSTFWVCSKLFEQLVSFAGLANVNIDSENSIKRNERDSPTPLRYTHTHTIIIYTKNCIYKWENPNNSRGLTWFPPTPLCRRGVVQRRRERACRRVSAFKKQEFFFVCVCCFFFLIPPRKKFCHLRKKKDLRV
jgi:hypothetical protein